MNVHSCMHNENCIKSMRLFLYSFSNPKMFLPLTIFLLFVFSASAQDDIGCFVAGQCKDSNTVGLSFPVDSNGCLQVTNITVHENMIEQGAV